MSDVTQCGHPGPASGAPVCAHLERCGDAHLRYIRWYVGSGLRDELLCLPCADARAAGVVPAMERVCARCFERITTACHAAGSRGQPEILERPEPFAATLVRTALPADLGVIDDLAALPGGAWLLLSRDGALARLDPARGTWAVLARIDVPTEAEREPWMDHRLRRRVLAAQNGHVAAVVNDHGRYGQVVDLRSGAVTLALDGGDYKCETVPFSIAFACVAGRQVVVHRTDWNRLDVSDPETGELLTRRGPTTFARGEQRPAHYLDYFHGALAVNPSSTRVVDDGWVWHPIGVLVAWSLDAWLSNPWESEDGPTRVDPCARDYWDQPMAWLDDAHLAIGGIGDHDFPIVAGARVFDVTNSSHTGPGRRHPGVLERIAFAGPSGAFFGDGDRLYSADDTGLSRWNAVTGERTGHLPRFRPTHQHRGARELARIDGDVLERMALDA